MLFLFFEFQSELISDADLKFIYIVLALYVLLLGSGIYLMYYLKKKVFKYIKWFKSVANEDNKIKFE